MKSPTSLKNQKLNNLFFFTLSFFPFQVYSVHGKSMLPLYKEHQRILLLTKIRFLTSIKVGDIIVFYHPITKQKLLKRVADIKDSQIFVMGDNNKESTDSRSFGWVEIKNIIGKVIYPV